MQTLWIPGPLPGLNEIIAACNLSTGQSGYGRRWNAWNEMKQKWTWDIRIQANAAGNKAFLGTYFTFMFAEPNRRRDPDNFVAAGHKIVLDACVSGGFMKNDGWKNVEGFADYWVHDPERPGLLVMVTRTNVMPREEAYIELQRNKAAKNDQ